MDTNEMLPSPEDNGDPLKSGGFDSVNESEGAQRVEKKFNPAGMPLNTSTTPVNDDGVQGQTSTNSSVGATTTAAVAQLDVPEIAEDIDLIEKIWVKKAKDIVDATTGDPHKQTNQINKMKVEYIKKRYNKDIKFKEE